MDTLKAPNPRLDECVVIITDGSPWFNEEKAVDIFSVHQNNSLQATFALESLPVAFSRPITYFFLSTCNVLAHI